MCAIVELTFRYLIDRPVVHSDLSGLPFMVSSTVLIACSINQIFELFESRYASQFLYLEFLRVVLINFSEL